MRFVRLSKNAVVLNLFFASLLFVAGCEKNNPETPEESVSMVEGKVSGNGGYQRMAKSTGTTGVGGASVYLAEIKTGGTLETVSRGSTITDASGKFEVETNLSGARNLVVVAQKENEKWEAVVTSEVKLGSVAYSQPLNDETTSEAEIYLKAVSEGHEDLDYDEIAVYIDSVLSARIKSDTSLAGSVESAIYASLNAQRKAYAEGGIDVTPDKVKMIAAARAEARASLDRNLYFSSSQTSIDAAFNAYSKDILNAYLNAGVTAVTLIKVMDISQLAFVNSVKGSTLGSDVKFELIQNSTERKSELLDLAVQSEFSAKAGTQAQLNGMINAGNKLIAAIGTASDTAQINIAFNTYRAELAEVLTSVLGLNSQIFSTLQTLVDDLKVSLNASLGGDSSADAIVAACINFYSGVSNAVASAAGLSDSSKIKEVADAFILLNTEF